MKWPGDIAARFNHIYGRDLFVLPEADVNDDVAVLSGLDGRKMSKSYNNTIPLFTTAKKLQKNINRIKTNLLEPGDPKDPDDSTVFEIWQAFASPEQTDYMRRRFQEGIGWGDAKKELFALIDGELAAARDRYNELVDDPEHIEKILQQGATRARKVATEQLAKVRSAVGIGRLQ